MEVTTSNGTFKVGELCFAHYWKNLSEGHDTDLFYCKIESIRPHHDHVSGTLYYGDEWTGKNRKKGRFTDICINDLVKL